MGKARQERKLQGKPKQQQTNKQMFEIYECVHVQHNSQKVIRSEKYFHRSQRELLAAKIKQNERYWIGLYIQKKKKNSEHPCFFSDFGDH